MKIADAVKVLIAKTSGNELINMLSRKCYYV